MLGSFATISFRVRKKLVEKLAKYLEKSISPITSSFKVETRVLCLKDLLRLKGSK